MQKYIKNLELIHFLPKFRIFADENSVDVRSREREPISYSGDMYDIETSK